MNKLHHEYIPIFFNEIIYEVNRNIFLQLTKINNYFPDVKYLRKLFKFTNEKKFC